MNKNQLITVATVVFIMFSMLLYPPFEAIRAHGTFNMGYGFIFGSSREASTVNLGLLSMQWVVVVAAGVVTWFFIKDKE